MKEKKGRSRICQGKIPDDEACLTVSARSMGSSRAKTPHWKSPTQGRNHQVFVPLAGGYPKRNVMSVRMRQRLNELTAGDYQLITLHTKFFLGDLSSFQICHKYTNISKFKYLPC